MASTLATREMAVLAPLAAASITFLSALQKRKIEQTLTIHLITITIL